MSKVLNQIDHSASYQFEDVKYTLFNSYSFSESEGDRVLFYAKSHDEHQLTRIKYEFDILKQRFSAY